MNVRFLDTFPSCYWSTSHCFLRMQSLILPCLEERSRIQRMHARRINNANTPTTARVTMSLRHGSTESASGDASKRRKRENSLASSQTAAVARDPNNSILLFILFASCTDRGMSPQCSPVQKQKQGIALTYQLCAYSCFLVPPGDLCQCCSSGPHRDIKPCIAPHLLSFLPLLFPPSLPILSSWLF